MTSIAGGGGGTGTGPRVTLRVALAASFALLAAPAWTGAAPAWTGAAPGATLRVGVPAGPDLLAGFDRSLFAEAAREAGLGIVFEGETPEAALAGLDAGRLDVAAGPFPPDAAAGRRALMPVAADGDALLKRRGDGSVPDPGALGGKVVGAFGPAASVPRLRSEASALGARAPSRPTVAADPLRDLAAGRVAALLGPLFEVAGAALVRPDALEVVGPPLGRTRRLAALVRGDRPDLAEALDAALGRMRADGRLFEVQRRWFGVAFDPPGPQPVATSKP